MLRTISSSFLLALNNIRSNLFHTFLSVLGIVIGVGALVSILSLIDGMEQYARTEISSTTSVNAIVIHSELYKRVNEVRMRRDTISVVDYSKFSSLSKALTKPAQGFIRVSMSGAVTIGDKQTVGVNGNATGPAVGPGVVLEAGSLFTEEDLQQGASIVIVNKPFLDAAKISSPTEALGKQITFKGRTLRITGILKDEKAKVPQINFPITLLTPAELLDSPPEAAFEATHTEDVASLKEEISSWLKANYTGSPDSFLVFTNEFRVAQATKAFLLFRVIMGLIVGISVMVGGIGVMNVLLISVTERTAEIGIRKAMGANRKDIVLLFLSESITISVFGSLIGLVFGIVFTMIVIPIVKAVTEVPFQAAYTLNTLLLISLISVAVGIIFGTYPAMRASRLDPVEAIRHE